MNLSHTNHAYCHNRALSYTKQGTGSSSLRWRIDQSAGERADSLLSVPQPDTEALKVRFRLRDPASAITHLIALLFALLFTWPLLYKAALTHNIKAIAAMSVFMGSMILLYGASSSYHSFCVSDKTHLLLKRIDHAMIFVLIAGSYTPVCLLSLSPDRGLPLLLLVWSAALIGIIIKIAFVTCPKWVSSIIYISMGWMCLLVFKPLVAGLSKAGFFWLLTGGIIYTIGGIIYSLKLKIFDRLPDYFGRHEIFHLFVMGGSFCHYIFMYRFLL